MKTMRLIWVLQGALICFVAGVAGNSSAQVIPGNPLIPVVTIRATQPIASRTTTNSGVFTVLRAGNPTNTLNVYYTVSGTASNGVDYKQIGPWVEIPAGANSSTITVTPINNGQTDLVQTVVVQLTPSPLMMPVNMPVNYEIGWPSNATVYIKGNGATNVPPAVSIVNPPDGSVYYTPVNLGLIADAYDVDGYVTTVEFFTNNVSIGVSSNFAIVDPLPSGGPPPGTRAFFLQWSNVPPDAYALTAKATDNGGASSVSSPVNIKVLPGPPPTNLPPVVRITSPPNGAVFRAPVDVPLFAYARDPDGSVASVQFFDNGNSLGYAQPVPVPYAGPAGGPVPTPILASNLYYLLWTNPPLGAHALTAAATDNDGAAATSAPPVNIYILPSPPPPTNRPPIVSIVALDPIAIEGTNCWPWLGLASAAPTWSNWAAATRLCRLFTNCGPKNATFVVRRCGDTNLALTLPYAIGGTATNGVDYVTLPGSVTIPAGERAALITLVPLDDGPPDINSTVVLKLAPSANSPPDYLLGFPRSAAALILDRPSPRPCTSVLPDRCFHLSAAGPDGAWFHIEYTTDLLNWTPLCTNQVVNGAIEFVDPDAPADGARFYRTLPELNAPMQ